MPPEVLRGKPLSEKADIYSFAIVCWEIMTRREPFENHDSYDTFVRCVCEDKERPPIPNDIPKSIKDLMEICWNDDPSIRPTFSEIINMLDYASIEIAISDSDARVFWRSIAQSKIDRIPFHYFSQQLWKKLGQKNFDEQSTKYKCLYTLLAQHNKRDETDVISLENFGLFVEWFGPFLHFNSSHGSIIDRLETLCSKEYFHGDIERVESEQKLSKAKKGSFLLRASLTDPGNTPFTISKVNREGVIIHQRVHFLPQKKGFQVTFKSGTETKKMQVDGPITELIHNVAKDMSLKQVCAGSKFSTIFTKSEVMGGYQEE